MPDTMAATIADMQRRLQVLESTSRVGLNRIRMAWSTHTFGVATVSTIGAFENGPVTALWEDDQGATGTGYPVITMVTGKKVIILEAARQSNTGTEAAYASKGGAVGVGVDGLDPFSWIPTKPDMHTTVLNGSNAGGVLVRHTNITGRMNLTPGSHTFRVSTFWNTNGGVTTYPDLSSIFLAIIPID